MLPDPHTTSNHLYTDYPTLFHHAPDAYLVTDSRTRILAANNAASSLFNTPLNVLHQTTLLSFVKWGERSSFRQREKRLMKYPIIEDWEVTFKPHRGNSFTGALTAKTLSPTAKQPRRFLWVIRNITERKQMEIRLSDHIEAYRRVNETIPDIIYETDKAGKITFISGATARLLGSPAGDLLGKNILDLGGILNISQKRLDQFFMKIAQCIKKGVDTLEHSVEVDIEGRSRHFELNETIHCDTAGTFSGLTGVIRDVTQKLIRDQDYRIIVDRSPHGIIIIQNIPLRFVFVNTVIASMLGYAKDEIQSFSAEQIKSVIHPDDWDNMMKRYQNRLLGNAEILHYEIRFREKNGSWIWLEMFPNRIEYNGKLAIQATFIDITEKKQSDLKILTQDRFFQTVIDDIHVGIYRTTPEPTNRFMFVNRTLASLLGYSTTDELLSTSVYNVYDNPKDRADFLTKLHEQGTARKEGVRMQKKDGSSLTAVISAHAIRGGDNGIIWIEGIIERIDCKDAILMPPPQDELSES